jgi:predicted permease
MQIKYFFRNLARNKTTSVINVFGLAVGVAAVLLIYRIVHYELGFNKNFKNYERIVRVLFDERSQEGQDISSCVPIPAMTAIQQSVPQFEAVCRVREIWPTIALPNPGGGAPLKKFITESPELSMFVEPSFFKLFDLQWLAGDARTALQDVGSVVLTQTLAEKCFGNWQQAMGQTLVMDNLVPLAVRGVVADLPKNCDFMMNMFVSYATLPPNRALYFYDEKEWGSCSSNNQLFALLKDPSQRDAAAAVLAKVGEKEYADQNKQSNTRKFHFLQPLPDLHYNDQVGTSGSHVITKSRLWILSFIGLLVLAMACFNFINLATASATQRAKEVGVRKTLGVSRRQLLRQFMGETATVTAISVLIGTNLAVFCLPQLKHISDVPVEAPFLLLPQTWAFLAGLTAALTLLAGFYPSIVLAGFDPAGALKSGSGGSPSGGQGGGGGVLVRKGLVVLQFSIAAALIVGALVTLRQLDFMRKKDLGFDKNLVYTFYFNNDSTSLSKLDVLKQRLLQIPSVEQVSFSTDHPASHNTWSSNFAFPASAEDAPFEISLKFADAEYRQTYGLRLVAGRWFAPSDSIRESVVNETFLRKMGIRDPAQVVGQQIKLGSRRRATITGVVADFHSHSLHQPMEPLLISTRKEFYYNAGVKIEPGELAVTTAAIQKAYDEVFPEQVFSARFFDERIARFYTDEDRFANTCKGFAGLAVLIACLGLFGLSMHAAARRTKEIGIRKVLGATTAGIVGLLSKDFLKLVILSLVIGLPVAWWLMDKWLADFAFRIDMSWGVFALAGSIAIVVATFTVAIQSMKAALANPVKSLRSE